MPSERPVVRGEDDLLGEHVRLGAAVLLGNLDHDLMDRGLDGVLELVPLLRHDRERRHGSR